MLYRPNNRYLSNKDCRLFYENIFYEVEEIGFSIEEMSLLKKVLFERIFDKKKKYFFFYHFVPVTVDAVRTIMKSNHPLIIELGCGSGSSSLLFALLGGKVIGIDKDKRLIDICNKRKKLYEDYFGPLFLEYICADAFNYKPDREVYVDYIYSLHAINVMQPTARLIKHLASYMREGSKIYFTDLNVDSIYNKIFRRRNYLKIRKIEKILLDEGFRMKKIRFQYVVPPQVVMNENMMAISMIIDQLLGKYNIMKYIATSYTIMAAKS